MQGDPKAAAVHRARADQHYTAADRFRRHRLPESERDALDAAEREEHLAEMLAANDPIDAGRPPGTSGSWGEA